MAFCLNFGGKGDFFCPVWKKVVFLHRQTPEARKGNGWATGHIKKTL